MCLALPMQVMEIDGFSARCQARGAERRVSLFLLQHDDIAPGDMVLVHLGQAIQRVSAEEAQLAWSLYDELLQALPMQPAAPDT